MEEIVILEEIVIWDEITPDTLADFQSKLEKINPQAGNMLNVSFNSIGGCVASALVMYEILEALKQRGVIVSTSADGCVYSSAVLPYLAGSPRFFTETAGADFLVHKVTTDGVGTLDLGNIDDTLGKTKDELEQFTEAIQSVYKEKGVSQELIDKVATSDGFVIKDFEDAKNYGLVDEKTEESSFFSGLKSIINLNTIPLYLPKNAKLNVQLPFNQYKNLLEGVKRSYNNNTLPKMMDPQTNQQPTDATPIVPPQNSDREQELLAKIAEMQAMLDAAALRPALEGDYEYEDAFQPEEAMNFCKNFFSLVKQRRGNAMKNIVKAKNGGFTAYCNADYTKMEVEKAEPAQNLHYPDGVRAAMQSATAAMQAPSNRTVMQNFAPVEKKQDTDLLAHATIAYLKNK